ncbi:hypothetical protein TNCV_2753921 [Trichonephila clavipes]|nr:hypothetical protein TNCV_2753921 [Trichonephila clavipes]
MSCFPWNQERKELYSSMLDIYSYCHSFEVNTRDFKQNEPHVEGWKGFDKNHEKDRGGFGKFERSIGQGWTERMEGKPSDGRDYSTWMNVARFSCSRALGDGPPNVEPFNGGVSIESRLFPKRGRPSMQGNLEVSNGKRRSKQAKHAMRTGQIPK